MFIAIIFYKKKKNVLQKAISMKNLIDVILDSYETYFTFI